MMFNYPYFGFPYYNRYSRYGYKYPYYNNKTNYSNNYSKTKNSMCEKNKKSEQYDVSSDFSPKKNIINDENTDAPMFEFFGIKLFFDDILLICLIFFLYNEGVKDQSLFISLILLLLS